ncbi:MAG: ribonuclease H-like domain-containing protein [Anaerolineaceae bacterium]
MSTGSLSDRLKSLGVQLGANGIASKKITGFPIENVLEGELESTPEGEVFSIHKVFEVGYRHGRISMKPEFEFPDHTRWARVPEEEIITPFDLLFLDTETTGLAGGTGTLVFMVGLGYFQKDGFHLVQLFLKTPADVTTFLNKLENISRPFKALSTYNGKAFDIPLLNSQCILNHLPPYLKPKAHFDLLPLARRLWSNRLPSRTLKDVENEILGVKRTSEEIPGWMIPEMYTDYLKSGDSRPLVGVFYHNAVDILSLAGLFIHTADLLADPTALPDYSLIDVYSVARLFNDLGDEKRCYDLFDLCLKNNIDSEFLPRVINHLALYHRRHEEWDQAVELWKTCASLNDAFACIELAKYYEHIAQDYPNALEWCLKAGKLTGPYFRYNQNDEQIQHRQARLEKKITSRLVD